MKIAAINLQTYQNINGLKFKNEDVLPSGQEKPGTEIAEARFLDVLDNQEISFLTKNFGAGGKNQPEEKKLSEQIPKRRIDILA